MKTDPVEIKNLNYFFTWLQGLDSSSTCLIIKKVRQVLTCFRILTVWFLLLFVGLLFVCLGFFCPPTKFGQLVPYNYTILIMYFPNITTHISRSATQLVPPGWWECVSWPSIAESPRGALLIVFWKNDRKWFGSEFCVESFLVHISQGSACAFLTGKAL